MVVHVVHEDRVNINGEKCGFREVLNSVLDMKFLFLWGG